MDCVLSWDMLWKKISLVAVVLFLKLGNIQLGLFIRTAVGFLSWCIYVFRDIVSACVLVCICLWGLMSFTPLARRRPRGNRGLAVWLTAFPGLQPPAVLHTHKQISPNASHLLHNLLFYCAVFSGAWFAWISKYLQCVRTWQLEICTVSSFKTTGKCHGMIQECCFLSFEWYCMYYKTDGCSPGCWWVNMADQLYQITHLHKY